MGLKIFLKKKLRISDTPVLKCKWFKVWNTWLLKYYFSLISITSALLDLVLLKVFRLLKNTLHQRGSFLG